MVVINVQDHLQAGTTCIYNLYVSAASSYQSLEQNAEYLEKAKKHFRRCSDVTGSPLHISPLR